MMKPNDKNSKVTYTYQFNSTNYEAVKDQINLILHNSNKKSIETVEPNKKLNDDNSFLNSVNDEFIKLLHHYVIKQEATYKENKPFRKKYYQLFKNIFLSSYIFLILISIVCLILYLIFKDIVIFSAIIPFFVETLSTTIIIPKIIAQYLFNTEEEKNLAGIIENIQKHNESVRIHQRPDKSNMQTNNTEKSQESNKNPAESF